jgi:hypothetical protein
MIKDYCNMMNRQFYLLFVFILGFSGVWKGYSQPVNSGFLGKKNFLTVSVSGGLRGLSQLTSGHYSRDYLVRSDQMKNRLHIAKWDVGLSYMTLVKRNLGLGMVLNYASVPLGAKHLPAVPVYQSGGANSVLFALPTSPLFTSFGARIAVTTCAKSSLLPLGFSSTISFGPRYYTMAMRSDAYAAVSFSDGEWLDVGMHGFGDVFTNPYKLPSAPGGVKNSYWGMDVVYTAKVTYPITRYLLFEFGVDLRLGLVFPNAGQYGKNRAVFDVNTQEGMMIENYWNANYTRAVLSESLGNIFNLRTGLTFAL